MAFIVEDGTGRVDSNSYTDEATALEYLTDRNRQTENTWSTRTAAERQAGLIAASDFIDHRFGLQFKGIRTKRNRDLIGASNVLTATVNLADTETVVIGARTYTFVAALTTADQVLVGADAAASLANLAAAINDGVGGAGEGTTYGTGTVINADFAAVVTATQGDQLTITARTAGRVGNNTATTETAAGASWAKAQTQGGFDQGDVQGMEFPRQGLVTPDGRIVPMDRVPELIIAATIEYAVRAVAATLQPDPSTTSQDGEVTELREKVGPIETTVKYASGTTVVGRLNTYPAADSLLDPFLKPAGVIR